MDYIQNGIIVNRLKQQLQRKLSDNYHLLVKQTILNHEVDLMLMHTSNHGIPDVIFLIESLKGVIRKLQRQGVEKIINMLPRKRKVILCQVGVWSSQGWSEAIAVVEDVKVKLPLLDEGEDSLDDLLIELKEGKNRVLVQLNTHFDIFFSL